MPQAKAVGFYLLRLDEAFTFAERQSVLLSGTLNAWKQSAMQRCAYLLALAVLPTGC